MAINSVPKRPNDGVTNPVLAGWLDLLWQFIKVGVYTPTLTNVTNLSASTVGELPYLRIWSVCIVGLTFTADTVAGAPTGTELGISLPIPSSFTAATDAMGSVALSAIQQSGRVSADATNDRLAVNWDASDTANRTWGGLAIYLIK